MKHTDFDESNFAFNPPEGDDGHVLPLKCYYNGKLIISAWDLTQNEILNLLYYRWVWLRVESGNMPPVLLEATSPFIGAENVVNDGDKEKARSVKERLANSFLLSENYIGVNHISEEMEQLRGELVKFIDFLCQRGGGIIMKEITNVLMLRVESGLGNMMQRMEFEIIECLDLKRHNNFQVCREAIERMARSGAHIHIEQTYDTESYFGHYIKYDFNFAFNTSTEKGFTPRIVSKQGFGDEFHSFYIQVAKEWDIEVN